MLNILERLDFQNNMEPTRPIYKDAKAEIEKLRAALEELTGACEVEFESDQTGDEPDDEPVGGGLDQEGKPDWMTITFGMIRRARVALTLS